MTDFQNGDSYKDYVSRRSKVSKTGFCLSCGLELSKDEFTYCHKCEHVYQEWQESLRNGDE